MIDADPEGSARARAALESFMLALWTGNAKHGIWQAVYSLEGTLPLLLMLEGPQALVDIAQQVVRDGARWGV